MGLGLKVSFDEFFIELQIDETIYLLLCTLRKPTLFLECKPCDIHTNISLTYMHDLYGKQIKMDNLF